MATGKNQHWLPQYYFRSFTGGGEAIHILHRKSGKQIFNASIKHQCSKNYFYGSQEVESNFAKIDGAHATVINRAKSIAWQPNEKPLTDAEDYLLLQAVLFQRARTALQIEKDSPAIEKFSLTAFRHHVECASNIDNRDLFLKHIDSGDVRILVDPKFVVLQAIAEHLKAVPLIADLQMCVLCNQTDYPFIFGDSPVVFYNTYYRNVTKRGVLGLQTPGLQVFMPLDSVTCLMLIDSDVYEGRHTETDFIDVVDRSDVSHLNALQLHHSFQTAYFVDRMHADYVDDLWRGHAKYLSTPRVQFLARKNWLIDDKPVDTVYQQFEPHLNHRLHLTFVKCNPIAEGKFEFRRRRPEVAAKYKAS